MSVFRSVVTFVFTFYVLGVGALSVQLSNPCQKIDIFQMAEAHCKGFLREMSKTTSYEWGAHNTSDQPFVVSEVLSQSLVYNGTSVGHMDYGIVGVSQGNRYTLMYPISFDVQCQCTAVWKPDPDYVKVSSSWGAGDAEHTSDPAISLARQGIKGMLMLLDLRECIGLDGYNHTALTGVHGQTAQFMGSTSNFQRGDPIYVTNITGQKETLGYLLAIDPVGKRVTMLQTNDSLIPC